MTGRDRRYILYRDDDAARRGALAATLALAAILLAPLWPLVLAALAALSAAWLTGMHPARLLRAAAWSAPMTVAYLAAAAFQDRTWRARALQPVADWRRAGLLLIHAHPLPALLITAPLAVPAGLAGQRRRVGMDQPRLHPRADRRHRARPVRVHPAAMAPRRPHRPPRRPRPRPGPAGHPARDPGLPPSSASPAAAGPASLPSRSPTSPATWSSSARPAAARPP